MFPSSLRPKITRLDFKKNKLTLVVVEDDEQVTPNSGKLTAASFVAFLRTDSAPMKPVCPARLPRFHGFSCTSATLCVIQSYS